MSKRKRINSSNSSKHNKHHKSTNSDSNGFVILGEVLMTDGGHNSANFNDFKKSVLKTLIKKDYDRDTVLITVLMEAAKKGIASIWMSRIPTSIWWTLVFKN